MGYSPLYPYGEWQRISICLLVQLSNIYKLKSHQIIIKAHHGKQHYNNYFIRSLPSHSLSHVAYPLQIHNLITLPIAADLLQVLRIYDSCTVELNLCFMDV
ncbi:hypothetical protein L1987_77578 [Smallanthus sonchifolius]|uniref:Uncharacterized protein n=1 Tax=Smallanthus sonchifolius TaxID=185202 RepID=A0ACB8ZA91_9ASTR|nr:hypothetical protein L1987_77578 [Smallanthus sonchifolius]